MTANSAPSLFTSLLDRAFERLGYVLEPYVPRSVTPNSITLIGFAGDIVAGIALYLSVQAPMWSILALAGITIHVIADSIDGAVARVRGQASKLGAFLDQMTDNFSFVALPLGIGLSGQARMEIVVFVIVLVLMHSILQYNWALWTGRKVYPIFGSIDYEVTFLIMITLMLLWPSVLIPIAGYDLNWYEVIFTAGSAWSFIDLSLSMRKLVKELSA
jgi:phosphatidylglycerophosphate synthase